MREETQLLRQQIALQGDAGVGAAARSTAEQAAAAYSSARTQMPQLHFERPVSEPAL